MNNFLNRIQCKFDELFGIDVRSLALMRIGFGLIIVADLIIRGQSLTAHYTDWGALPRYAILTHNNNPWYISIHMMSGSWMFQCLLFVIAGLCAFSMVLGYRTRIATVLSWFFLMSLQNRNFLVLQGGDLYFRVALFWAMFLPWGERFSLDSLFRWDDAPRPQRISSLGTLGYLLQIVFVYGFTALLKTGVAWTTEGSAIYYALAIDQFTLPLGRFLWQFPHFLTFLTFSVFYLELLTPILLFVPILTAPIRIVMLLLLFMMHAGIHMSMRLGLFHWISLTALAGFIPSQFWDGIGRRFRNHRGEGLSIYYDEECQFCKRAVQMIKKLLLLPKVKLLPAQTDAEIVKDMEQHFSWVIVDQAKKRHFKFEAFLVLVQGSPLRKLILPLLSPKFIRRIGENLYSHISSHRNIKWLPQVSPQGSEYSSFRKFLFNACMVFLIGYVFFWNISTLPYSSHKFPKSLQGVANILRIDQMWNMFAPYPFKDDGWFVIPGKLADGTKVDLFTGGKPVTFEKPTWVSAMYPDQRWRKYTRRLWLKRYAKYRLYYGQHLCREWNSQHEEDRQLKKFFIAYMREDTLPNYRPSVPKMKIIWRHNCLAEKK